MADLLLQDYIALTRYELMAFGSNQPVTDGDSTDPNNTNGSPTVSITKLLNQAAREMAFMTKYLIVDYTGLTLVDAQREYVVPSQYAEIENVYIADIRMMRTTQYDLSDRSPTWRSVAKGATTMYYRKGTNTIGFHLRPDTATAAKTLTLVVTKVPTAMSVLGSDIVEGLGQMYQDALPARAAWYFCNMDADNPKAAKRMPELEERFNVRVNALATVMFDAMNKDTDAPTFLPPALASRADRVNPMGVKDTLKTN